MKTKITFAAASLLLILVSFPAAAVETFTVLPNQALQVAQQFLLPGAGSVAGANGTFFHSDITLLNYRNADQRVAFQWLPEGATTTTAPIFMTVHALSGVVSEDFVGQILQLNGLGSLIVSGVNPDGTPDPNAQLYLTERVWTLQPGSSGTVSESFPALPLSEINITAATILGQRIDARYRTNVGIVNFDTADRQFDIVQTTDDPANPQVTTTVTVPAMSMLQTGLPSNPATALQIVVRPRGTIDTTKWAAYGSTVDNVTGDSWSSLGFQAR